MPYLKVGSPHSLYYEEVGNAQGQPILFVHGGPGYGFQPNDRDWFADTSLRGILVDQRGAGRSKPLGELKDNTAQHLVSDFEALRQHLGIESWHLFGGSWGTTLSLYYAECHPTHIRSLTLRSVCLMDNRSVHWYLYEMANFFPDAYLEFTKDIPSEYIESNKLLEYYATQILDSSDSSRDVTWEKKWCEYENRCVDPRSPTPSTPTSLAQIRAQGRIECLYFRDCRLPILDNLYKIRNIPTFMVHGRYDVLSPVSNAFIVYQRLADQCELHISEGNGHSARDPNTYRYLLSALQRIEYTGTPLSVYNS